MNMEQSKALKMLNLDKADNFETIKAQYRKLAMKYHPDRPTGDEVLFKQIQMAYDWLEKNFTVVKKKSEPKKPQYDHHYHLNVDVKSFLKNETLFYIIPETNEHINISAQYPKYDYKYSVEQGITVSFQLKGTKNIKANGKTITFLKEISMSWFAFYFHPKVKTKYFSGTVDIDEKDLHQNKERIKVEYKITEDVNVVFYIVMEKNPIKKKFWQFMHKMQKNVDNMIKKTQIN